MTVMTVMAIQKHIIQGNCTHNLKHIIMNTKAVYLLLLLFSLNLSSCSVNDTAELETELNASDGDQTSPKDGKD